jgi:hypothetical protein
MRGASAPTEVAVPQDLLAQAFVFTPRSGGTSVARSPQVTMAVATKCRVWPESAGGASDSEVECRRNSSQGCPHRSKPRVVQHVTVIPVGGK